MNKQFKPEGYNSVSPYFIVMGAQRFIDLLKEIFDAKLVRRYDKPDGSIMHAEVQIDDSIIMLGDASEQFPPTISMVHVYVPDVNGTYEKAMKAGCENIQFPQEQEGDPDRRGTFRDFSGNIWSIGMQLKEGN